jgi:hypothetical protein
MDWREYEAEIEQHFREEYPHARITRNAKMPGVHSGVLRQIDVLVEQQLCDMPFRIVVDGKFRTDKLDVKDVEEFLGLVEDVQAHKAVLVSLAGYTEAATTRASKADLILDVLNFDELHEYQGLTAIPYAGEHGAVLQPPLGWVVDGTQGKGALAWLYQRGLTLPEAQTRREFMYVNFWKKKDDIRSLDALIAYQNEYLVNNPDNPATTIEMEHPVNREDAVQTAVRKVMFRNHPGVAEYTGFVDFDGFVMMCVLFCRDELAQKNLRNLRFVLRKVFEMHVIQSR